VSNRRAAAADAEEFDVTLPEDDTDGLGVVEAVGEGDGLDDGRLELSAARTPTTARSRNV